MKTLYSPDRRVGDTCTAWRLHLLERSTRIPRSSQPDAPGNRKKQLHRKCTTRVNLRNEAVACLPRAAITRELAQAVAKPTIDAECYCSGRFRKSRVFVIVRFRTTLYFQGMRTDFRQLNSFGARKRGNTRGRKMKDL